MKQKSWICNRWRGSECTVERPLIERFAYDADYGEQIPPAQFIVTWEWYTLYANISMHGVLFAMTVYAPFLPFFVPFSRRHLPMVVLPGGRRPRDLLIPPWSFHPPSTKYETGASSRMMALIQR